jgi:hypothetical protein
MQANARLSRLHTHFLTSGKPLSKADAVEILGAVLFYLREKDVVRSLSEMHANNSAQGTLETIRYQLWRETYGRRF